MAKTVAENQYYRLHFVLKDLHILLSSWRNPSTMFLLVHKKEESVRLGTCFILMKLIQSSKCIMYLSMNYVYDTHENSPRSSSKRSVPSYLTCSLVFMPRHTQLNPLSDQKMDLTRIESSFTGMFYENLQQIVSPTFIIQITGHTARPGLRKVRA